jgi:protein gp37
MKDSKIEWCDHTFNPWEGCTKVSPGCANCYAENRNARFGKGTAANWGKGAPRRRTSVQNWAQPLKWNHSRVCISCGHAVGGVAAWCPECFAETGFRRPRVFCASLADWLDDEVPLGWLQDLLRLIHDTPHLDWLLLTKRPENFTDRMWDAYESFHKASEIMDDDADDYSHVMDEWLWQWLHNKNSPANVWIGTTVEDQARADERIPALLRIPARVRFLSCEPLLGPVDLLRVDAAGFGGNKGHKIDVIRKGFWSERFGFVNHTDMHGEFGPLHWVIGGGESGPKARAMHPEWMRSLRNQCADAGVPFLFKQWGEWAPAVAHLKPFDAAKPEAYVNHCTWVSNGKPAGIFETTKQQNLTTPERPPHSFLDGEILTFKIGKSEAGRLLDGIEHNGFPA